jgi:hypothetical protein
VVTDKLEKDGKVEVAISITDTAIAWVCPNQKCPSKKETASE